MDKSERSVLVHNAAAVMLECYGVGAIWDLHLAGLMLRSQGHAAAADVTISIADAAEREWLRQQTAGFNPPPGDNLTPIANS